MQNWDALKDTCSCCSRCGLCETRTNVVFGIGNEQADIMFVGEGPGQQEDLQGEPFGDNAVPNQPDIERVLFQEKPIVIFIHFVAELRPKSDPYEHQRRFPRIFNAGFHLSRCDIQNTPSQFHAVEKHGLHRLITPRLTCTNACGVANIHHRRNDRKHRDRFNKALKTFIKLRKRDNRAKHRTDMERKLIHVHAAVHEIVHEKVGNVRNHENGS